MFWPTLYRSVILLIVFRCCQLLRRYLLPSWHQDHVRIFRNNFCCHKADPFTRCAFGGSKTHVEFRKRFRLLNWLLFPQVDVRLAAIQLSRNAVQGMNGGGPISAYADAVKLVTRYAISDKSHLVRCEAGKFLEAVALVGGPGMAGMGLEPVTLLCLKVAVIIFFPAFSFLFLLCQFYPILWIFQGIEDPVQAVRDSFALALGAIVALSLNPGSQVKENYRSIFFMNGGIYFFVLHLDFRIHKRWNSTGKTI